MQMSTFISIFIKLFFAGSMFDFIRQSPEESDCVFGQTGDAASVRITILTGEEMEGIALYAEASKAENRISHILLSRIYKLQKLCIVHLLICDILPVVK